MPEGWLEAGAQDGAGQPAAVLAGENRRTVTRAPSFSWVPIGCSLSGLGGSRGDGLCWSPAKGLHDTTAPGFSGDTDWQQGDAPQSAG